MNDPLSRRRVLGWMGKAAVAAPVAVAFPASAAVDAQPDARLFELYHVWTAASQDGLNAYRALDEAMAAVRRERPAKPLAFRKSLIWGGIPMEDMTVDRVNDTFDSLSLWGMTDARREADRRECLDALAGWQAEREAARVRHHVAELEEVEDRLAAIEGAAFGEFISCPARTMAGIALKLAVAIGDDGLSEPPDDSSIEERALWAALADCRAA